MITTNRFSGWLSAVKKGKTAVVPLALLIVALAVLLTTCAGGTGDGAGVFTLVTGSGTVTVNLVGAAGDFEEYTFYYGTTSTGTPLGGQAYIDGSDNMLMTLNNGDADIVFTGGMELLVGGFIDVSGGGDVSHMADNGDWMASKTVTVSGNQTVVLTYPDDFTPVTGSGTVTVNLTGAGLHDGKTFYFGTTSAGDPIGGEDAISEGAAGGTLPEGDVEFTGGMVLEVGGFIDVNGNGDDFHMPDDGDWVGGETVTVSGNETVDLSYLDDFTEVLGSGTVSVNLKNAFSDHAGESFFYGTTSTGTPLGGQVTIDSNGMLLTIPDDESNDVKFTGGSEILVGGFIDVNGNGDNFHMADDGDYQAAAAVTVSGDTVVTLTY